MQEAWPETAEAEQHLPEPDPGILARLSDPAGHGGALVAAKWIVAKLIELELASKVTLAPGQMGFHPNNRSSYGISEDAVFKFGKTIMDIGFSLDEIINPWCAQ